MIIPIALLLLGVVGLAAKGVSITLTLKRIKFARTQGINLYAERSGTTTLNLQYIGLVMLLLLMAINGSALIMEDQPMPITTSRIVRGILYCLAYIALIAHAVYGAYRYLTDTKVYIETIDAANTERD